MDTFVLWLLGSALGAAVAAYVLLLFAGRAVPFWVAPAITLIVALLLVGSGVVLPLLSGVPAQVATALVLGWGGWMLLGLRRG